MWRPTRRSRAGRLLRGRRASGHRPSGRARSGRSCALVRASRRGGVPFAMSDVSARLGVQDRDGRRQTGTDMHHHGGQSYRSISAEPSGRSRQQSIAGIPYAHSDCGVQTGIAKEVVELGTRRPSSIGGNHNLSMDRSSPARKGRRSSPARKGPADKRPVFGPIRAMQEVPILPVRFWNEEQRAAFFGKRHLVQRAQDGNDALFRSQPGFHLRRGLSEDLTCRP